MAKGISAALPLILDEIDGPYRLNKTIPQVAAQNLKMLLLTNPGERIMMPQYGVGLSQYIFENDSPALGGDILGNIRSQVSKYLPYIFLEELTSSQIGTSGNILSIQVVYSIPNIKEKQNLSFILNNG
jgi:phage baseplate assembly protein W